MSEAEDIIDEEEEMKEGKGGMGAVYMEEMLCIDLYTYTILQCYNAVRFKMPEFMCVKGWFRTKYFSDCLASIGSVFTSSSAPGPLKPQVCRRRYYYLVLL